MERGMAAGLVLSALAFGAAACGTGPAEHAGVHSTTRRTVKDYFLQTPDRYFQIMSDDLVTANVRATLLTQSGSYVDIPNGYLFTSSPYADLCNYVMAVFRRSRGSHLVALNVSCTMGDHLTIIDPDRNWKDVTSEVFPVDVSREHLLVALPRVGRLITIAHAEDGSPIAEVDFIQDRFVRR